MNSSAWLLPSKMVRSVLLIGILVCVDGLQPSRGGSGRVSARRSSSIPTEMNKVEVGRAAVEAVVREAAEALRDGARSRDLVAGAAVFKELVSTENAAGELTPSELAAALEAHLEVYGPLLAFDNFAEFHIEIESPSSAVATTTLVGPAGFSKFEWALSRRNDNELSTNEWFIDAVEMITPVQDEDEDFTPSPMWVASRVLKALRSVDEPDSNHGVDVALDFVSPDNPSSSLTREIFRSYLDDKTYPYGILTRWQDMRIDPDIFFDDVDDDDDEQFNDEDATNEKSITKRATLDVTLIDDDQHDNTEWTVTLEMSKYKSRGWLIDRVWCETLSS
mmetsp:Transcript_11865/g.17769  ORF Transcript_11865/g.17769 Transcript_11865/m.17769 type:complete len:334 (+) Transcript_11865:24-1025(+)